MIQLLKHVLHKFKVCPHPFLEGGEVYVQFGVLVHVHVFPSTTHSVIGTWYKRKIGVCQVIVT